MAINEGRVPWSGSESITAEENLEEIIMLGLRIREGLDLARVNRLLRDGRAAGPLGPSITALDRTRFEPLVDEGLVTLEDIVEELVGEIWDEHDEVIEEFKKQEDGSYLISCSADLTDLFDLFKIKGECDSNTISGWVMEQIGRVPEEGDRFVSDGLDVTVTKGDHRRVLEIRVEVLPEETDNKK